jgi:hypothetical protein
MARFAANTSVPVDRTRQEIEQTLARYGATAFGFVSSGGRSVIMFEAASRNIKISMAVTSEKDDPRGQQRRQKWRALLLVIKAKLESVASGIETLEEAFYANIVLPDGQTVYEATRQRVAIAYDSGKVQRLLPDYSNSRATS